MKLLRKILYSLCTTCKPNRSRTVRYAFPIVFAAVAFLGAQAIVSDDATYITIEPSTNSLRAGEPFYLNVYVTASTPINAVDLQLSFPEDQVDVKSIDTGESVITIWTQDPYVEGNTVHLSGGTFRRGFVGEHLIATINADAVSTGIADIEIASSQLLAGDGSGSEIEVSNDDNEEAKIYIANEDGSFSTSEYSEGSELSGIIEVNITTDLDGDGDVSLADVSSFMSAWRNKNVLYDFNNDRRMTFIDFGIILSDSFFK